MANLQKIKAFAPTGEATSAPPLGPLLGQYQINISDFVPKFNSQSLEKFEKGIHIGVIVLRDPKNKTYKIKLKGPTLFGLINSVSKLSKRKKECISFEQIYDIVKIKYKLLENNSKNISIEGVASSIFSTISNSKINIYINDDAFDE